MDLKLLLSCLKWRYSARDHIELSHLGIFEALHTSPKLRKLWGKPINRDFTPPGNRVDIEHHKNDEEDYNETIRNMYERFMGDVDLGLVQDKAESFMREALQNLEPNIRFHSEPFRQDFEAVAFSNRITFVQLKNLLYGRVGQFQIRESPMASDLVCIMEQIFTGIMGRLA